MATLSAPLLRSLLPIRSSPRRFPAAAFSHRFSPLKSLFSSRPSHTVVRSSSTASPEAAVATGEVAQSEAVEEKARVVLPTNESSENLLRIRHTVILPPSISPLPYI
jgi:hypothetical protein